MIKALRKNESVMKIFTYSGFLLLGILNNLSYYLTITVS